MNLKENFIFNKKYMNKAVESIIYNIIFDYVQHMVYIMRIDEDNQLRYEFVNESGLAFAGLDETVMGKTLKDALPFDRYLVLQKTYDQVIKKKEVETYSDSFELDNGEIFHANTFLSPVMDEQNEIRYIVAVTRDVTDLMEEKNSLIMAEQKYRSIVDHNLDGIFAVSLDGNMVEVNPAASQLLGYCEEQIIGRSFFDLVQDASLHMFKELFHKTMAGTACESLDCRFIHSNGHGISVHIKTVPIVIQKEITGLYVIIRDITEQAKNVEMIKYMAFHDQLTGLFNRRALLQDLEEMISKNKVVNTFALISIDLDRFKYLNDTLGHLAGDQILIKVAERLSDFSRNNIKVYRQGGDEYNILFEGSRKEAAEFAQKILAKFSKSFYLQFKEYFISPSIGISMFPNDGKDAEVIITNSFEALLRVKERGRGHYQFYRTEMNSEAANIVTLETHLRKALSRNELTLCYQPQVDLKSGEINSCEALLRWNSPELGSISPAQFIPLAEDTGMIVPIGNWVIDTACRQIGEWSTIYKKQVKIAVNISPKQFLQPKLVATIQDAINKYNIHPSLLEVEITEGAMQDTAETLPILKSLKEIGVAISIDDFGTGYSSLNYIKQFPIDVLKIDQSFVRDAINNTKDRAITTTIIYLANSLGIEVVAEGIEKKEHADFLLNANCHKGQGFLFSRPIPAAEFKQQYFQ